jgi:hypothetical protein
MVKKNKQPVVERTHIRSKDLERSEKQAWSRSVALRMNAMRRANTHGTRQFQAARRKRTDDALQVGLEDLQCIFAGSPINVRVRAFGSSMFELMFDREEVINYGKMIIKVIQKGHVPGAPTAKTSHDGDMGKPLEVKQLNAKRRGILWMLRDSSGADLLCPDAETLKTYKTFWDSENPYRADICVHFPDDSPSS